MDSSPEDYQEESTSTPIRSGRVYTSNAAKQCELAEDKLAIELIQIKEYSNVNRIADCNHLTDEN